MTHCPFAPADDVFFFHGIARARVVTRKLRRANRRGRSGPMFVPHGLGRRCFCNLFVLSPCSAPPPGFKIFGRAGFLAILSKLAPLPWGNLINPQTPQKYYQLKTKLILTERGVCQPQLGRHAPAQRRNPDMPTFAAAQSSVLRIGSLRGLLWCEPGALGDIFVAVFNRACRRARASRRGRTPLSVLQRSGDIGRRHPYFLLCCRARRRRPGAVPDWCPEASWMPPPRVRGGGGGGAFVCPPAQGMAGSNRGRGGLGKRSRQPAALQKPTTPRCPRPDRPTAALCSALSRPLLHCRPSRRPRCR